MFDIFVTNFVEFIYMISNYLELNNPVRVVILFLDITIVTFTFAYMYKIIKKTRAEQIVKGILWLLILYTLAKLLNLVILNFLFDNFMTYGILILIVVFQPELRSAFEKLGRMRRIYTVFDVESDISIRQVISEIVNAAEIMSLKRVGALIVIEKDTKIAEVLKESVTLDARVSSELLQNIFFPRTPLHDGAVVIEKNRIVAAKCILPLSSETNSVKGLGTRHRAAVGISEASDALVIVVSEETGIISLAENGKLKRELSGEKLKDQLLQKLCITSNNNIGPFKGSKRSKVRNK